MDERDDRRAAFLKGLEAYAGGDYRAARAVWGELWRDEPDFERSALLQALLQLTSALDKVRLDIAAGGATRHLELARERLEPLPDHVLALDVRALDADLALLQGELASGSTTSDGRLGIARAPRLALTGELGAWSPVATEPSVPAVARSAWFEEGLAAYRRGAYFDAHELWEALWRDERDDDHKQLLQGLIQVAAAMHKALEEGKPGPAASLLGRATLRLSVFPREYFGLDLGRLVESAQVATAALSRLAASTSGDRHLAAELIPAMVRLAERAS